MVSHLKDIRRCDEHDDVDFSNEEEIKRFVRPWKWVSLNVGSVRVLRINVRRVDALSERHIQGTHRFIDATRWFMISRNIAKHMSVTWELFSHHNRR